MIQIQYRSYGVGTFVLNEIIKIANKYTPDASLSGFLSPVDEGEDNLECKLKNTTHKYEKIAKEKNKCYKIRKYLIYFMILLTILIISIKFL